jgi:hypothetical protein
MEKHLLVKISEQIIALYGVGFLVGSISDVMVIGPLLSF